MSNMTAQADVLMTDEDRAEIEAEMRATAGSPGTSSPNPTPGPHGSPGSSPKKEGRRSGSLDYSPSGAEAAKAEDRRGESKSYGGAVGHG